jgi:hypothetical protein
MGRQARRPVRRTERGGSQGESEEFGLISADKQGLEGTVSTPNRQTELKIKKACAGEKLAQSRQKDEH